MTNILYCTQAVMLQKKYYLYINKDDDNDYSGAAIL